MDIGNLKIEEATRSFYEQMDSIPFGNSDFQEIAFVIAPNQTPERMYKAAAMQLNSCLKSLNDAYFKLQREDLEIEELTFELKRSDSDFKSRRLQIDLAEKQLNRIGFEKLVKDALHTYNLLSDILSNMNKPTREEFELAEPVYYKAKLERQKELLGLHGASAGAVEALINMSDDIPLLISAIPEAKKMLEQGFKSE